MTAGDHAKLAAGGYLASLDQFVPHAENINTHLRDLVVNITRKILLGDDSTSTAQCKDLCRIEMASTSKPTSIMIDYIRNKDEYNSRLSRLSQRSIARMDAFLEGCALALPDTPLPTTKAVFKRSRSSEQLYERRPRTRPSRRKTKSTLEGMLNEDESPSRNSNRIRYVQFSRRDVLSRLELYCTSLRRVRQTGLDCVVHLESPVEIEKRATFIVETFKGTAGNKAVTQCKLKELVRNLTCELLGLKLLGQVATENVNRLMREYEVMTSFSHTFEFLAPSDNQNGFEPTAARILFCMLRSYIEYLQNNCKVFLSGCELELMLSNYLDPDFREGFKNTSFHCVKSIFDACEEYSTELGSITIPPVSNLLEDIRTIEQTLNDVANEMIAVNGRLLPNVNTFNELAQALKEELVPDPTQLELYSDSSLDILVKILIVAATNRRGHGSFQVVHDLFNREKIAVAPSKLLPRNMITIDITVVQPSSVIITRHEMFNLYPKPFFDSTASLMKLKTTTIETISLKSTSCFLKDLEEKREVIDEQDATNIAFLAEELNVSKGVRILSVEPVHNPKHRIRAISLESIFM